MPDESSLRTWVSDKLMSLIGYSQPAVVQFVIGLSKKSSSPADVVRKLAEIGFSSSVETRTFAEEIFARVPHKATGLNSYQKEEKEAAMLAKKQKSYTLIDADDDDEENGDQVPHVVKSHKSSSHQKRFRKKSENEEIDDEEVIIQDKERRVRTRTSGGDDDEDDIESEEARIRDQEERAQLERNIRERDAAATRKMMEPKLSRKEEEEVIRRSNAMEENDISSLRKVSRQEYLKKREQKKLEELRDDILDEQYLFDGVQLTEAEMREMRYKKEIYELAKKRLESVDDITEYRMPDAYDQDGGVNQEKRFSVAHQRYRDAGAGDKMNPFAEQEAWEEHQIATGLKPSQFSGLNLGPFLLMGAQSQQQF